MSPVSQTNAHPLLTYEVLRHLAVCLSLTSLVSACAPTTQVVLLPQADNSASAVVVRSNMNQVVLDVPYQRALATGTNMLKGDTVNAEYIQKKYLGLFTAAPPQPSKFIVNFSPGGTTLTPESEAALPKILAEVAGRTGADMVVTGHTDTKGTAAANDALSLQRAGVVTQRLIDKGALKARIESVGRGERDMLVKTDDEVDEPKNRRVEILVR